MPTFCVLVSGNWSGHHIVEAANAEEAERLASDLPVPDHIDYSEYAVDEVEEE